MPVLMKPILHLEMIRLVQKVGFFFFGGGGHSLRQNKRAIFLSLLARDTMSRPALQRSGVQHQYDVLDGAEECPTPEDIEEGVTLPLEAEESPEFTPILDTADDALVAAVITTFLTITATPHTSPTMQARKKKKRGGGMRKCEEEKCKRAGMYCDYWRVKVPFEATVGITVAVGVRVRVRVGVRLGIWLASPCMFFTNDMRMLELNISSPAFGAALHSLT
jgi:hypothetical protein